MQDFNGVETKPLPRWITIPLGLIFTPFTLMCVVGSASLLVAPNVPPTFITVSLASVFLAGSIWMFYLSLRLLFVNPGSRKRLISPIGLRLIAMIFALIPVVSIALGTFWEKPFIHGAMTIAYIGIVMRLFSLAKIREKTTAFKKSK